MANEEMARDGYAVAFVLGPNLKYRGRIRAAHADAKRRGAGLWHDGGALTCPPLAFRYGRCL